MGFLRRIINSVVGNYSLYRIYRMDLQAVTLPTLLPGMQIVPITDPDILERSDSLAITNLTDYAGLGAHGFAVIIDGEITAALWVWNHERYRQRNFWPLQTGEVKIVDFHTHERSTGKGLLPLLIKHTASVMREQGYKSLYARVWHSDSQTMAAMKESGMGYHAFVSEAYFFGRAKPFRLVKRQL